MYIIIIGCGRIGSIAARELSNRGSDVTVIDRDASRLSVLGSGFNGQIIKGIEFDTDLLKRAGAESADLVLIVTPDDNVNITVSLVIKRFFNNSHIIARICSQEKKHIYQKLEIDTINPTQLGVEMLLSRTGVLKP